ncbi:raffinose synthase [Nitzschia inconspicua]|uniref:Raffinose synthase n=1 Tax=Nitzschia inconspicua TaxID=303405 RepID=A0A9K3M0S4_9STRA|nr:raffinose synthase [Nitzschia inconspicua]
MLSPLDSFAFTPKSQTTLAGDVLLRYKREIKTSSNPLDMVATSPNTQKQQKNKQEKFIDNNDDDDAFRVVYPTDLDKWLQSASASASSILTTVVHSNDFNHATVMTTPLSIPKQMMGTTKDFVPSLRLDQKGRLTIATPNENEQDVVLLEGLSTKKWKGQVVKNDVHSSSTFSSILLQTQVPFSAVSTISLGNLMKCHKLLAAARLTRYWMGPKFGENAEDIPVDTQFLLLQLKEDGDISGNGIPQYAVMMPLVDNGCRSTLERSESRKHDTALDLVTYSENGGKAKTAGQSMNALYVAVGNDPFHLLRNAFEQVADTLKTFRPLSQKTVPSTVNYFGWCTWDAFYSRVHPEGILRGIKSLRDAGVPARNLILDDGWQHVSPEPEEWTTTRNTHQWVDADDQNDLAVIVNKANTTLANERRRSSSTPVAFLFAKVVGTAIFDLAAKGLTHFYERFVQKSSHDSIPSRIWTFLARNTLLKQGLEKYFDEETDFCRQLDSFDPNWKFEGDNAQSRGTQDAPESSMTLSELVKKLKSEMGVKKVYCWHAIHGYWRGITSELGAAIGVNTTQVFTKASEKLLRMEPQMAYDTPTLWGAGLIDSEEDIVKFYQHLHGPLKEAGVDGVKVDVQSGVSAAGSGVQGNTQIAQVYTQAMEESVSSKFRGDGDAVEVINCMCHSTENLYRYNVTAVARASDDFYPDRPESHTVHLVNVAYNSLFLGEITLPDWDMFHSKHKSAELHGAARAIGGCPLYVSDIPGEHDVNLLKKLVLPDGSILRAQNPGRPTRDSLFLDVGQDGVSALKIWNTNGRTPKTVNQASGGVVGAFNVQGVAWNFHSHTNEVINSVPKAVIARVKPYDVETLRSYSGSFAVWSHRTSDLRVLPDGDVFIETKLDPQEWEVFTVESIQQCDEIEWAPFGLRDMINSGGAIINVGRLEETITTTNSTFGEDAGNGRWRRTTTAEMSARGPGRFVAYCQPAPSRIMLTSEVSVHSSQLEFSHDSRNGLLEFTLPEEHDEATPHLIMVVWDKYF